MRVASRRRLVGYAYIMAAASIGVFSACTPVNLQAVNTFATATQSLTESSTRAYETANETRVLRQMYDVASNPAESPKDDTFAPLVAASDKQTYEALQVRFKLLNKLGDYAGALKALCEADVNTEIDKAAADLDGSLVGLKTTYKESSGKEANLSDDDIHLIATAVNAIGKEIAEAKRKEAIQTIVVRANDAVQQANQLVSDDFGSNSQLKSFTKQNIASGYGSLRTAYLRDRATMTFEQRLRVLNNLRMLKAAESASEGFFDDVAKGAKAIGAAHRKLTDAVSADQFDIKGLAVAVGEISERAKSAREFYGKLKAADKRETP